MNDPHVVSLTYRRKPSEEVSYDSPPPLTFKRDLFSGLLDGDVLVLTPKDHYPSIELAQGPAERFLRAWEIDAELRSESGSIAFDYETGEVIDRNPPPPGTSQTIQVEVGSMVIVGAPASLHVTRRKYPEPPKHFEFTSDVKELWDRLEGYRAGGEPLLTMAYYCLTIVERIGGGRRRRAKAAKLLRVDKAVLNKLGELTSVCGDAATARKAWPVPRPLADSEAKWIVAALERIVRNLGEANSSVRSRLTLAELPPLYPTTRRGWLPNKCLLLAR